MNLNSFWLGVGCAGTPFGLIGCVLSLVLAWQEDARDPGSTAWMLLAGLLGIAAIGCGLTLMGALYNIAVGRDPQREQP